VARQYCGAAGKVDNCQVGVFLSWQTAKGHALIDRALYLPKEWTEDRERRRAAAVPEEIAFTPKPSLARAMIERVWAVAAQPAWVVADAVYGSDSKLALLSGGSRAALRPGGELLRAERVGGREPEARQDAGGQSAARDLGAPQRGRGRQRSPAL
jgi:hypothetical protein